MNNIKILIADDESRIRTLIHDFLSKSGYEVIEAKDGEEALEKYTNDKNQISLLILDVMMPKKDGWTVLKQIRKTNKEIPILMLTAKSEEQDELLGFELGVDEYITKPFSPKILVARVEAILKRTVDIQEVIECDSIEINNTSRNVTVDGKEIEMSLREYELLKFLIENKGIALDRERILSSVWNYEYYGDSRTIDSHIKKVRKKLGKKGKYIKTIRGVGYKFEVD